MGPEATVLLIQRVKAGDTGGAAQQAMTALAAASKEEHLLIACTELSLLTRALTRPFTDSLDCLVTSIRAFARS
jgi:aspartate/glutamate racemase